MIVKAVSRLSISGDQFFPSKLKDVTKLEAQSIKDVGELGKWGRFQGKERTFGSCFFSQTQHNGSFDGGLVSDLFLKELEELVPLSIKFGAMDFTLYLALYSFGQCNFEFSKKELEAFIKWDISLCISQYDYHCEDCESEKLKEVHKGDKLILECTECHYQSEFL